MQANEQTRHLIVVHVYDNSRPVPPELAEHVRMIDEVGKRVGGSKGIRMDRVLLMTMITPTAINQ